MLMIMMIINPLIMIFMKHPMSMGMTLLFQTIIITMITGIMNQNFWFSYILFLIMVGGMLILFTYMTSIASNEKFKFSNKFMYYSLMAFTLITLFLIFNNNDLLINMFMNKESLISTFKFSFMLSKFLNFPFNLLMYMMILYLLITLIIVVKITNIKIGPLRQMN
uniref:NADH-ubiquinone oxidoreductase chain 6 n=1 Tax=Anobiinae sp. BMNH 1274383 TaxID=1796498 RepID=A0A140EFU3_9COLE|nr:NADH dehydrogenase subunit 6 [Anobiinae sp. BMNH 1274383]